MLKSIKIKGLRGFSETQCLNFAIPTGNPGSGLTAIVGSNNAGKSTVIEAIRAVTQLQKPSFTQGRRNIFAGDRVDIKVEDDSGNKIKLKSRRPGTSETTRIPEDSHFDNVFVLSSRRAFNPFFHKSIADRNNYIANYSELASIRENSSQTFYNRLFQAYEEREMFNLELGKVVKPVPIWSIDQFDNGEYYLKITKENANHSSEGLGEGLISLLFIIDALYDSKEGDVIVIDEPELSLHPSYQKRLAKLFAEYSKDRQIIISTHSPYFINLENLSQGCKISRVHQADGTSIISQISEESSNFINSSLRDYRNPHTFGLNAREVFFLDDNIILVEGQEDVVFFRKILDELNLELNAEFFGWGIGGADKMKRYAQLLKELGFKKVVGILDNDRSHKIEELVEEFPEYNFFSIPADDVRTKEPLCHPGVEGLMDDRNKFIREKHRDGINEMFSEVKSYFE